MNSDVIDCLTINTDASFCGKTNAGGWAFYIRHDKFFSKKAGKFKSKVKDSSEAETKCIANALTEVLNQPNIGNTRRIIINTDSKIAIRQIERQITEFGLRAHSLLNQLVEKLKADSYEFRHVRAHTGKNDKRSYVNEWCDKEAKSKMRAHRIEINKKTYKDECIRKKSLAKQIKQTKRGKR